MTSRGCVLLRKWLNVSSTFDLSGYIRKYHWSELDFDGRRNQLMAIKSGIDDNFVIDSLDRIILSTPLDFSPT